MSKSNDFVFKALQVVAWVIFIGLCIEAGALIVNFVYSLFKPEVVKYLYQKLDLSSMYQRSQWAYYSVYSFMLVISILKATLFYVVIKLISQLDLTKPFSKHVADEITKMSSYTFSIGIISAVARETTRNLEHHGFEIDRLDQFWGDAQAYILMSAVIYVIATIFSKGVEIQNENDLTV